MGLMRYKKDARSIPVMDDSSEMIEIGPQSHFSVQDQKLFLTDPENGTETICVGAHIQYTVDIK